jgi:hypothetical protein
MRLDPLRMAGAALQLGPTMTTSSRPPARTLKSAVAPALTSGWSSGGDQAADERLSQSALSPRLEQSGFAIIRRSIPVGHSRPLSEVLCPMHGNAFQTVAPKVMPHLRPPNQAPHKWGKTSRERQMHV